MTASIIILIQVLADIITMIIIVDILLSYFMSPYHPLRMTLDKIVNPMLNPIRKVLPTVGMVDFSPIVLMLGIQLIQFILINVVSSLG